MAGNNSADAGHESVTVLARGNAPRQGGEGALLTNVVIELFRDLVLRARDETPGLALADGVGVAHP